MGAVRLSVTPMPRGHRLVLVLHPTLAALRKVAGGPRTLGATQRFMGGGLAAEVHLAITHLRLYVVAHEVVHVAYALRRRGCSAWLQDAEHDEEEHMAYPIGELTEAIVKTLEANGYQVKTSK